MQLTSILSIAALALGCSADTKHSFSTSSFNRAGVCGQTTWTGETSDKAPVALDCATMVFNLRKKSKDGYILQDWQVNDPDQSYLGLETEGSCTFGVRVEDVTNYGPAIIAKGDMADILQDALARFTNNGHIGASGTMDCKPYWGDLSAQKIGWRIFAFGE